MESMVQPIGFGLAFISTIVYLVFAGKHYFRNKG